MLSVNPLRSAQQGEELLSFEPVELKKGVGELTCLRKME